MASEPRVLVSDERPFVKVQPCLKPARRAAALIARGGLWREACLVDERRGRHYFSAMKDAKERAAARKGALVQRDAPGFTLF